MDFDRLGGAGWTRSAFPSLHPLNAAVRDTATEPTVENAALVDEVEDVACIDEEDQFDTDSNYI
jgi:DNA replicative helicase MCM subunit Mcm2 (Cdc46/Mcm family)